MKKYYRVISKYNDEGCVYAAFEVVEFEDEHQGYEENDTFVIIDYYDNIDMAARAIDQAILLKG